MGKAVAEKAVKKQTRSSAKSRSSKEASSHARFLYYSLACLTAAVALCYANSFVNQFVFDDNALVVSRRWPENFSEALRLLRYGYRPLREFSYALDIALWGKNPFGFHLTNTLIHAANVGLVFFLARRLMSRLMPSLIVALLFAVHPIQTDSVTYISGRRDVLFSLFYIAAFHLYLTWREGRRLRHLALCLVAWALSLMSKEMAVTLPLIIFLWNFCDLWSGQTGSKLRRTGAAAIKSLAADKWLYAPLTLAMAVYTWNYVFVRHASSRVGTEGVYFWGGSFYSNLLMAVRAQAWYLKQLVFPTPTAQYYGAFEPSYSILEWKVLLSILVVFSTLVCGFYLLSRNRLMAFAVFSYFAMLLPVSQIIPHHEFVADHYLYLPMMSFGLFVASGVEMIVARWPGAIKPVYATLGLAIGVLAVMTILTNRNWKDDFTLWQANYNAVPRSPRAAANLASQYAGVRGDLQKAEYYLNQALDSDPAYELAYTSLVNIYMDQKRYDKAEEIIHRGLEVAEAGGHSVISIRKPDLFRSQMISSLGAVKKAQGDGQEAEKLLREAIRLYPYNLEPYAILANLYHDSEPMKEVEILDRVIARKRNYYEIYARIVSLLVENRKYDDAVRYANRALALTPDDNDCRKAAGYLESAKKSAIGAEENSALADALRNLEQQCAR